MRHFALFIFLFTAHVSFAQTAVVEDLLTKAKEYRKDASYIDQLHKAEMIAVREEDKVGAGMVYQALGNCYYKSHLPDSCIAYHQKAYKLLMDSGEKEKAVASLHTLAYTYSEMKNQVSIAVDYVANSIEIHQMLNDTLGAAEMLMYVGYLKGKLARYDEARKDITEAISMFTALADSDAITDCWVNMALVYTFEHRIDSAVVYFEKAKNYWDGYCAGRVFHINNKLIPLYIKGKSGSEAHLVNENEDMLKYNMHYTEKLTFYKYCISHYTGNSQTEKAGNYTSLYNNLSDSLANEEIIVE